MAEAVESAALAQEEAVNTAVLAARDEYDTLMSEWEVCLLVIECRILCS